MSPQAGNLILSLLGFGAWTMVLVFMGIVPIRVFKVLTGQSPANGFPATQPHGSEAYQRLMRAHQNCIENLPLYAILVLAAALSGGSHASWPWIALIVPLARIAQSIAHVLSGSELAINVRFSFYVVQMVCFIILLVSTAPLYL